MLTEIREIRVQKSTCTRIAYWGYWTRITRICCLRTKKKIVSFLKSVRSVRTVWENSTFLTLLSKILSQTFRSSPYSHRPSGRDRRDRTCDTPLPCCQDSPLSASPGLWCSDASSAKNEADSRTGYDWHNPLRHAWLNSHSCGQPPLRCVPHCYCRRGWYPSKRAVPFWFL